MTDIKDNPPPLPDELANLLSPYLLQLVRQIEAAAFARGVAAMQREIERLENELETERLRLASCGVAALGYFDGCKDEYKSASLDDVLHLKEEADELRAKLQVLEEQKPVALWNFEKGFDNCQVDKLNEAAKKSPAVLYLSAGAKP